MNKYWNKTSKPSQRGHKPSASRNQNKPQKGRDYTSQGAKKTNEMDVIARFDHEDALTGSFNARDIKFYPRLENTFSRPQEGAAKGRSFSAGKPLPSYSAGKQKNFRSEPNITQRFSSNRNRMAPPQASDGAEESRKRSISGNALFPNRNADVLNRKNSKSPTYGKPQPQFILKDSKIIANPDADAPRRGGRKTRISATGYAPPVGKVPTKQRAIEYYRINRYISQSGLCSRREADQLIKEGRVKINGQVCTDLATRVLLGKDQVTVNNKSIKPEKMVYLLLNKPKNHITTAKDPEGRLTVMDLVKNATPYRLFPVGRLDRNTTGILLLTNDGELATKLTHPSYNIRKLYYVKLDRPFSKVDMEKIKKGISLDDGLAKADQIDYVEGGAKSEIGVEIHSGRNRLVRRMFEHLGYRIVALDRVAFGPIDKKGVPRGKWRFLTSLEIGLLKMMR